MEHEEVQVVRQQRWIYSANTFFYKEVYHHDSKESWSLSRIYAYKLSYGIKLIEAYRIILSYYVSPSSRCFRSSITLDVIIIMVLSNLRSLIE